MKNKKFLTNTEWLREHLYDALVGPEKKNIPDLESLRKTEWSPEFEWLMRNRLVLGAFRYGLFDDPDKPKYDRRRSIRERLDDYEVTGNRENLVDIANVALMEFEETKHTAHFESRDDENAIHDKEKGEYNGQKRRKISKPL